ncbi:hypothetical protein N665_0508s0025 [Sinapis alba]|nr:hypothetical protein N665_0508s0025 [Sinapis alba]
MKRFEGKHPRTYHSSRVLTTIDGVRSPLSSSSFIPHKFDFFLSFRGANTCKNFELEDKGIRTFKDDKELVWGCLIAPELVQTIKGSRIAIVVVSATYPILKLEKEGLLTLVPIFYEVDPCQVRTQTREVAKQFKKHEKEIAKREEDDAMLVDGITERISELLLTVTPSNDNKLIGVDEYMKKFYLLLDLNSNKGVQVSGVWGRGSKGRSALARHIYQNISHNFEAHCFLEDVRSVSLHRRKSHLQEELLFKMQGEGLSTRSSHMCYNAIKARLKNKKILLLYALAEEFSWFGPESRIIITTKGRHLLSSWGVKSVYEVEHIRCYEVGKLWRSKAFKKDDHEVFEGPMNCRGIYFFSSLKYLMDFFFFGII